MIGRSWLAFCCVSLDCHAVRLPQLHPANITNTLTLTCSTSFLYLLANCLEEEKEGWLFSMTAVRKCDVLAARWLSTLGWQLVLTQRDSAVFRDVQRVVLLGGSVFTVVRDCFSLQPCGRFGKVPLPFVGFVLVGSAWALQCLPRSAGGISVLMGSDVHYVARCSN